MDLSSSFTIDVVAKALDGLSMRHKALASNLANVDTPNYSRQSVSFETNLQKAIAQHNSEPSPGAPPTANNDTPLSLRTTDSRHLNPNPLFLSLDQVQPSVEKSSEMDYRTDGNSVDVESEMVNLARNTDRYRALAEMEKRMIEGLKRTISSGGEA